jgi:DNA-binding NarL/FixJ family response regulator
VILMDIHMPEPDGLEVTRRILATNDTRILILTAFGLNEYVSEALHAGASGFVLEDDPPEQLIAAVRTVACANALLSPEITKHVMQEEQGRAPMPLPSMDRARGGIARRKPRAAERTRRRTAPSPRESACRGCLPLPSNELAQYYSRAYSSAERDSNSNPTNGSRLVR